MVSFYSIEKATSSETEERLYGYEGVSQNLYRVLARKTKEELSSVVRASEISSERILDRRGSCESIQILLNPMGVPPEDIINLLEFYSNNLISIKSNLLEPNLHLDIIGTRVRTESPLKGSESE